jgi:hypothetical protein
LHYRATARVDIDAYVIEDLLRGPRVVAAVAMSKGLRFTPDGLHLLTKGTTLIVEGEVGFRSRKRAG